MTPIEQLTLDQQRLLCEVCCRFEDSWGRGERLSPEDFLSAAPELASEIASEILLQELSEVRRELELQNEQKQRQQTPIQDERYELIEEIARGGAASIWRVRDRHLQRETAIKYLLDSCDNHDMRARLEREARLCARLVHPGIVPIHELSSFSDGRPFVSMKLVEGQTLLQLLEKQPPLTTKSAIEIFTKVCQAVAFAHDRGIIHRDLKPRNIMVGAFGEVQIMDWGLGKELNPSHSAKNPPIGSADHPSIPDIADEQTYLNTTHGEPFESDATLNGTVLGTLAYMAPEQASGHVDLTDRRSDVFALGAILCRILTGLPPYHGSSKDALLQQAQAAELHDAQQRLRATRYRKLAGLAKQCMSVDPDHRPENAQAVVDQLAKIRRSSARAKVISLAILGAIAWAAASAFTFFFAKSTASDYESSTLQAEPKEPLIANVDTLKSLLRAGQHDLALESYQHFLGKNPQDQALFQLTCVSLMNRKRYPEAENVAKRLLALDPTIPTPYFILSDALMFQGKFEEAIFAMQEGKRFIEPTHKINRSFDEKLAWLKSAIEISQTLVDSTQDQFPDLSGQELQDVAKICEMKGKTEQALKYHRLSVNKEIDAGSKSLLRHSILVYFIHDNLTNSNTQRATRNLLCQAAAELLNEQLEFARQTLASTESPAMLRTQAMELLGMWKSHDGTYRFIEDAAVDSRIDREIRSELAGVIRATSELHRVSTAASQLNSAD